MGESNPNIQRISFEEIQEFKNLDLFNLTWEQTNGRLVLLAYDPVSKSFVYSYTAPGEGGGDQNITLFYGHSDLISRFIDDEDIGARPSINGFDNGDGIIATGAAGSVNKFDFFDVEIDVAQGIDRYVYRTSLLISTVEGPPGYTPVKNVDYFDGAPGKSAYSSAIENGYVGTEAQWIASLKGIDATSDQKFIVYPEDFVDTSYAITAEDNKKSIIVLNGITNVSILISSDLPAEMQVGFVRDGVGEVALTSTAGVTLKNAINGLRIKDRYDQAFIEQGITPLEYYVLGTTKV